MKSRNAYEKDLMRRSGQIAAKALKVALQSIQIGVNGLEVDKIVTEEIYRLGGDLSYKSVPGYKYATCITVNEEVVHGMPTGRKFEEGDLVSVDLAVVYKGWHTDCAWSKLVGEAGKEDGRWFEKTKFLKAGEAALWGGIARAVDGNRVGDISAAIQERVEKEGFAVVRSLVGHGIGRNLHEDPEIPCFGKIGSGKILRSGMTLAIEVIYTAGGSEVILADDGWTFKSIDGSLGGLFELTVIIDKDKAEVLTDWKHT